MGAGNGETAAPVVDAIAVSLCIINQGNTGRHRNELQQWRSEQLRTRARYIRSGRDILSSIYRNEIRSAMIHHARGALPLESTHIPL